MARSLAADTMASIRKLYAPEFANENTYVRICHTCGGEFLEWKGTRHPHCPECAHRRQTEIETQTASAPDSPYARAVLKQYEWVMSEMRRLGLSPGVDQ